MPLQLATRCWWEMARHAKPCQSVCLLVVDRRSLFCTFLSLVLVILVLVWSVSLFGVVSFLEPLRVLEQTAAACDESESEQEDLDEAACVLEEDVAVLER